LKPGAPLSRPICTRPFACDQPYGRAARRSRPKPRRSFPDRPRVRRGRSRRGPVDWTKACGPRPSGSRDAPIKNSRGVSQERGGFIRRRDKWKPAVSPLGASPLT
jgi:hypothetical protein